MFYNKKLVTKKVNWKKLSFSSFQNGINTEHDEHLTPIHYSRRTYNFNFQNGALKTGLGVSDLNVNHSLYNASLNKTLLQPLGVAVLKTWLFYYYDENTSRYEVTLLLYGSDKKIYFNILNANGAGFAAISGFTLEEVPNVITYKLNGKDVIIFTNKTDGMFVWNFDMVTPYKVNDAPNIMSMCVHAERLFSTVSEARSEVWFSDDLDPTNWSVSLNDAGFIQMADERGPLNKVISLNDYVYVFREYGISRIAAWGNQKDFSVTNLFFSNSKIYEKTVCACGDNIFFLAKDGIYVFDGLNATKLNLDIENLMVPTENAHGAFHNGKYYLAMRMNFHDGLTIGSEQYDTQETQNNNVLLELNVKTGAISLLRGANIVAMTSINHTLFSKLVVCLKSQIYVRMGQLDENGSLFEVPTPKFWLSPETDLGNPIELKLLKELHVHNHQPFTFTVTTENETRSFGVPASGMGITKVKLGMKAKVFSFAFSTNQASATISNPQLVFGEV